MLKVDNIIPLWRLLDESLTSANLCFRVYNQRILYLLIGDLLGKPKAEYMLEVDNIILLWRVMFV